jgi:hypothetical protein
MTQTTIKTVTIEHSDANDFTAKKEEMWSVSDSRNEVASYMPFDNAKTAETYARNLANGDGSKESIKSIRSIMFYQ